MKAPCQGASAPGGIFPAAAKVAAARALNEALEGDWPGFEIESRFPLEKVAEAHQAIEGRKASGRVVLIP